MSLPRAGSSYPGYYPNLPTRPPDMGEIKGEYIEDCDGIKEEDNARLTPGPGAIPPEFLTRPSWPGSWPSSSAPALVTSHPMPGPRGHAPPGGLMPPLTTSLTPLQLIQKLSSYAATNRKRAAPSDAARSPQSPPSKRIPVSSPSFQPRIEQVMSLQCPDKSQGKEANNNSSSPPAAPDLAPSKSMIDCPVCGDIAVAHFHYGGMCCYSCKAFFRRVVNTNKATKYKCRAGNNQCDVSLANRRSCQACRYKKCVAAGMKPGLVLSDDQCQKKFGPKKGARDDSRLTKVTEEEVDDPGDARDTPTETEEMADDDYSVLIDPAKSLSEQNRLGRQLFVSIFSTGSVSSGQLSDEELEMFRNIDNNNSVVSGHLAERQVQNARKFISFFQFPRAVFLPSGMINFSDVVHTLVDQTVLVLKQNQDFKTLSSKDQTELLESNAMVVSLLSVMELYSSVTRSFSWPLTETDYQALRKLNIKVVNGRAVFGLADVSSRVETELGDDVVKLFKFCDYFTQIGVPKSALYVLAVAVIFTHDCCDIENKVKVEEMRRRYLIILFECLATSDGVLGACKIALKLHNAIHHLNRICQLFAQKFVTVQE